jgi:hypothetical protein
MPLLEGCGCIIESHNGLFKQICRHHMQMERDLAAARALLLDARNEMAKIGVITDPTSIILLIDAALRKGEINGSKPKKQDTENTT